MDINQLVDDLMVVNIFARCTQHAAQIGAVNLAQGVPEPLMDNKINETLAASVIKGWQYVNPRGLDSLRHALSQEYNDFTIDDVLVTSGCTESLYLAVYAAAKLYGNKIAFFEPFYPYYTGLAKLLSMEAYPLPMQDVVERIQPDWNLMENVFQTGVRVLILNTPHNPSGWVMRTDEALQIRALAEKYGVLLIVDEAYRYYTYSVENANQVIELVYKDNENVVLVGSASKLFSATGLRLGWMLGRKSIMDIAYALHLYTTYCHPAPLQQLLATLLENRPVGWFAEINKHYHQKRDKLYNALITAGFKCRNAEGGHFLLADYSGINNHLGAEEFAYHFVAQYGIMPLPVSPLYIHAPKQLRFSFSVSMDTIQKAVDLINNR